MAQYKEGRVSVTFDSETVSGLDTAWVQSVDPGDLFLVRGEQVSYRVASVINNTSLRLTAKYGGPSATNVFYSITRDFTPNLNLPIIYNGDVDAVAIFAEALTLLDSKWAGGGGGGTPGTGISGKLASLTDVNTTGAQTGDTFTVLPNGSFGFVRPYVFTIAFTDAGGDGGRIIKSYANGTVTYRRIKVSGGTIDENANDLTINLPAPGEANNLVTAGSQQSASLVSAKQGTNLRIKGLRVTAPLTLVPEGEDLVLGSTVTSGGQMVTYTLAPIGGGTSLVATPSGTELRVKTITFDSNFTVGQPSGAGITVTLNKLPITHITTVLWDTILAGQVLYRNAAGNVVGLNLPSPGISSLSQDSNPTLSAPLQTGGRSIVGQPVTFSGAMDRPKNKSYTICLSAPVAFRINGIVTGTEAGSLSFRVDIGGPPESDDPNGSVPSALQGTAQQTVQTTNSVPPLDVDPGESVVLTVFSASADIADFAFTISGVTT